MAHKAFATFFAVVVLAFSFAIWSAHAATTSAVVSDTITPPADVALQQAGIEATPAAVAASEYNLPYPGLLPDHPLYKVKLFRDRALNFLIRDPVKRIEFNLLMADKRLNMGIALVQKERYTLSEETVSKGEKYFVNAIDEFKKARDEGRVVPNEVVDKLRLSSEKHILVITELQAKSPENLQEGFGSSLRVANENRDRLISLAQ